MKNERGNRDIIVIGGSAGALEPLKSLMAVLPADLPAAVFIVLHIGATSYLARILDQAGPLPVKPAASGAPIEIGRAYVAVPDRHLLLHDGHLLLRRGPRENMARPAIDPLFRSAACTFGGRVIGVLLSGGLNDGTAGLEAIRRCGGTTVIQDPDEAAMPEMPSSAARLVQIGHCLSMARMGPCLVRLAREPAGETPKIPESIQIEAAIAAQELPDIMSEDRLGSRSPFSCPDCHGPLWEVAQSSLLSYRCHLGHAFTAQAMLDAQSSEVDRSLQDLARVTRERAELVRRMAEETRARGNNALAAHFVRRSEEYRHYAEALRRLFNEADIVVGSEGVVTTSDGEEQEPQ